MSAAVLRGLIALTVAAGAWACAPHPSDSSDAGVPDVGDAVPDADRSQDAVSRGPGGPYVELLKNHPGYHEAYDVEVDRDGTAYWAGSYIEFIGLVDDDGGHGAFVAKQTPSGELAWMRWIGNQADNSIRDVEIGEEGNIFAWGYAHHYISPEDERSGRFLAKIRPDGDLVWIHTGIALESNIEFDGEGRLISCTDSKVSDRSRLGLAILDPETKDETHIELVETEERTNCGAVTGGPQGAIYLTSTTRSTDLPGLESEPEINHTAAFLMKIDGDLELEWTRVMSGSSLYGASRGSLATGADGGVYVAGRRTELGGGDAMFAAHYDSAGRQRWQNHLQIKKFGRVIHLTRLDDQLIFVTGSRGSLEYGQHSAPETAYVGSYDLDGHFQSIQDLGANYYPLRDMAVDRWRRIYLVGSLYLPETLDREFFERRPFMARRRGLPSR